jgi:hypothetical protein
MLKTLSAALLAATVIAAPALAATSGKSFTHAPAIKAQYGKPKVMNANARMSHHAHHHRYHHRHHPHHKIGSSKAHSKVSVKQFAPTSPKRPG